MLTKFFPTSSLISRPFFPHHPVFVALRISRSTSRPSRFRSVAHCSLDFLYVPFSLRRALLAGLVVRHVSVLSRVARSSSCLSVSRHSERIAFSAAFLFLSGIVCSMTSSALWAVCFTDCLQCTVFGVFCFGFVLH